MKKYSVIIPAYQTEDSILKCVNSLLTAKREDFEVIVVNDCSKDKTIEVLSSIEDSRLNVITLEANAGVSQARNIGLMAAIGDYITFVDSDDYVPENYFFVLDEAAQDGIDIAIFNFNVVKQSGEIYQKNTNYIKNIDLFPEQVYETLCIECSEGPWNKLYKHALIEENHVTFHPQIKMWEDMLFFAKAVSVAKKIRAYNKNIYFYKETNNGLTSMNANCYINDFIIMNQNIQEYLSRFDVSAESLINFSVRWLFKHLCFGELDKMAILTLSKSNVLKTLLNFKSSNKKVRVKQLVIKVYFMRIS